MTSYDHEEPPALAVQAIDDDGDLTDMLGELRVLLPTAQLLSAFLIAVPFAPRVPKHRPGGEERLPGDVYAVGREPGALYRACGAARLMRRCVDASFKARASRQMLVGAALLATALVLATQFVLSEVLGHAIGNVAAGVIGALIGTMWLLVPLAWIRRQAA
jgi:hypothetical protein